jgi:hypothetical protein
MSKDSDTAAIGQTKSWLPGYWSYTYLNKISKTADYCSGNLASLTTCFLLLIYPGKLFFLQVFEDKPSRGSPDTGTPVVSSVSERTMLVKSPIRDGDSGYFMVSGQLNWL